MRTYSIGDTIYHGDRYWKQDNPAPHERVGWNTEYVPFKVVKITAKRIHARSPDGTITIQLDRKTMETKGEQYHSRFHEYFYAKIPKAKPVRHVGSPVLHGALNFLSITPPYTPVDVRRAYKRLAPKLHPDRGGSHDQFLQLTKMRDIALRGY